MELTTVSTKGQIVIPENVRKQFKIKTGERLVLFQRDQELVLRREKDVETSLREQEDAWKLASQKALYDLWDNSEDEIWNKYA